MTIPEMHERLLTIFLDYRKSHPEFTFAMRTKKSGLNQDDRFAKGYWFTGNDNYIFIGLVKKSSWKNKTKSIGLHYENGQLTLQIVWGGETNEKYLKFYHELVENLPGLVNCHTAKYEKKYGATEPEEIFYTFVTHDYPVIIDHVKKHGLETDMLYNNQEFDRMLHRIQTCKQSNSQKAKTIEPDVSFGYETLNQIFYGPPGTGKTYHIQNQVLPRFTDISSFKTREEYLRDLSMEYSWPEAVAFAMAELGTAKVAQLLEHPVVEMKARRSVNKNIRAMLWAQLQMHTKEECSLVNYNRRSPPLLFEKSENSLWHIDMTIFEEEYAQVYEDLVSYKKFVPKEETKERYKVITFHQSFSYEEFVEGIRPNLTDEVGGELGYILKKGILREMVDRALEDPDNEYALIIDEINRGNISKIFGELITLIEEDKRLGADNEQTVILPYSQDRFGIPSNLYFFGTMNTADRSIAMMDTALRRRFTFVQRMPQPELLTDENEEPLVIKGIDIQKLLTRMNERIEFLYDREHTIGHSYFWKLTGIEDQETAFSTLQEIFKRQILPLLEEYFYDQWDRIRLVLGDHQKPKEFQFVSTRSAVSARDLFGSALGEGEEERVLYGINERAFEFPESYIHLYQAT